MAEELSSVWFPQPCQTPHQAGVHTTAHTHSSNSMPATPAAAETCLGSSSRQAVSSSSSTTVAAADLLPVGLHVGCQCVCKLHQAGALSVEGTGLLCVRVLGGGGKGRGGAPAMSAAAAWCKRVYEIIRLLFMEVTPLGGGGEQQQQNGKYMMYAY